MLPQMLGSVWKLMSTQLNVAVSMATAIISVLLSGGTVLLNFIVSVVSEQCVDRLYLRHYFKWHNYVNGTRQ